MIPDAPSGTLWVYGQEGSLEKRIEGLAKPSMATTSARGVELAIGSGAPTLAYLDDQLELSRRYPLEMLEIEGGRQLGFFPVRTSDPSGRSYALSDIRAPSGEWERNRYLWFEIGPPPRVRLLAEGPEYDQEYRYLLLLDQSLASIDGELFALRMTERPHVARIGEKIERWIELPAPYSKRPPLPKADGRVGFLGENRVLETGSLATALVAWDGNLWVLVRDPAPELRGHWKLLGYSPRTRKLLATLPLPSDASHVVIAPGPARWAFLEKGPMQSAPPPESFRQDVESLLLIPSNWVSPDTSPLAKETNEGLECVVPAGS